MKTTLKAGHTFLIQGPASVRILRGSASTLGESLTTEEPLVVRAGRLKAIEATDESMFDIVLGHNAKLDELQTSTIPVEWKDFAKDTHRERPENLRTMVLGGLDTGKNTLITYLGNILVKENFQVVVMDADMGQGEIGPPTTMSVSFLDSQVTEFLELNPDSIFFVGSTSPAYVVGRVLRGVDKLNDYIQKNAPEATLLINMPGWTTGQAALKFILQVISTLKVNRVVALQKESELEDILREIPNEVKLVRLPVSPYARTRSKEERKFLRETSYRKYFEGSKDLVVHFDEIDFSPMFSARAGQASFQTIREVERITKSRVLYCDENSHYVNAIIARYENIAAERIPGDRQEEQNVEVELAEIDESARKELRVASVEEMRNAVVAILGDDEQLVSVGILKELDLSRRKATIAMAVKTSDAAKIEVGKVRVSDQGHEIGYIEMYKIPFMPTESE
jgi:polynucleotide 5'-hydroxyl-kinase GRC3/NOL9